ncbi:hypothetical protein XENTR_v10016000 [Xenopus tropicalis]|nr:hypothetical protein XENTR_v10016000 [Xenopus tropicalis]
METFPPTIMSGGVSFTQTCTHKCLGQNMLQLSTDRWVLCQSELFHIFFIFQQQRKHRSYKYSDNSDCRIYHTSGH